MPHQIDDRYTDGVWYDLETGDFCEFVRTDEGTGLVSPGAIGEEPYYIFEEEYDEEVDAMDAIETDFRKVPEDAVEDPVAVVNRALRILSRNDIEELAGIPFDFAIGLRYARRQVEVTKK